MTSVPTGRPGVLDRSRRDEIYGGGMLVLGPTEATLELADFASRLLEEAFAPHAPRAAQHVLTVEEWVDRFAPVKPAFIHHPTTRRLLRDALGELGCDPDDTYFDVPRLRGVTSGGYLTSGVGYAHHPHRDTWYAAPMCQLNWWMPLHACRGDDVMAVYPELLDRPVPNSSSGFDYYEWNATGRKTAAEHIHSDGRVQPRATTPLELGSGVRIVPPVAACMLFSGAHLHATVPNNSGLTRLSVDFRTVSRADLLAGRGARNADSSPRGTSLRDFRRLSDDSPVPDEIVADHDVGASGTGELVYRPPTSGTGSTAT